MLKTKLTYSCLGNLNMQVNILSNPTEINKIAHIEKADTRQKPINQSPDTYISHT